MKVLPGRECGSWNTISIMGRWGGTGLLRLRGAGLATFIEILTVFQTIGSSARISIKTDYHQ